MGNRLSLLVRVVRTHAGDPTFSRLACVDMPSPSQSFASSEAALKILGGLRDAYALRFRRPLDSYIFRVFSPLATHVLMYMLFSRYTGDIWLVRGSGLDSCTISRFANERSYGTVKSPRMNIEQCGPANCRSRTHNNVGPIDLCWRRPARFVDSQILRKPETDRGNLMGPRTATRLISTITT